MSESRVPILKTLMPPVGSEEDALGELDNDEQESHSNTSSAQRGEIDAEPIVSVLATPLNPINLRRGIAYSGKELFISQAETTETELDEAEQNEQEVEGDASESDANEGHTNETEQDFEHTDRTQEWYTDDQISAFIAYTRAALTSTPPHPLVTFYTITTLVSPYPSPACSMLREASRAGLAQLVRSSDRIEVYTVGAPPPVDAIGFNEHWWLGLTPAQVRAGPWAEMREIQNAERSLARDTQGKREKNRWLNEERKKTAEGVRRQEEGTKMSGDGVENDGGERTGRRE